MHMVPLTHTNFMDDFVDDIFDSFNHPMMVHNPFELQQATRRRHHPRRQSPSTHWTFSLRLAGYKPEEVKVERTDNFTIKVHARQGSGDDFSEVRKTIHIPDNVDHEHVDVDFTREGVLIVRAPYKQNALMQAMLPFGGGGMGIGGLSTHLSDEMRALRDHMWKMTEHSFPGSIMPTFVRDKEGVTHLNMDFDLRGYKPEEIAVSHEGETVTVEARHEKQGKSGSSFKHFKQSFTLPENVKLGDLQSKLTHDGRLRLEAPCALQEAPQPAITEGGVHIPIKRN